MEPLFEITRFTAGQSLFPTDPSDPNGRPWESSGGTVSPDLTQFTILQDTAIVEVGPGVPTFQQRLWYSASMILKGRGPGAISDPTQKFVRLDLTSRGHAHLEAGATGKITLQVAEQFYTRTFSGPYASDYVWDIDYLLSMDGVRFQELVLIPFIVTMSVESDRRLKSGILSWDSIDGAIEKAPSKEDQSSACERFAEARRVFLSRRKK